MKSIDEEWIKQKERFNLPFYRNLLLLCIILLGFVGWTDLSEVVQPLDLLSESIDSIELFLDVPFDRVLLWAIMEIYDTLINGLKV